MTVRRRWVSTPNATRRSSGDPLNALGDETDARSAPFPLNGVAMAVANTTAGRRVRCRYVSSPTARIR